MLNRNTEENKNCGLCFWEGTVGQVETRCPKSLWWWLSSQPVQWPPLPSATNITLKATSGPSWYLFGALHWLALWTEITTHTPGTWFSLVGCTLRCKWKNVVRFYCKSLFSECYWLEHYFFLLLLFFSAKKMHDYRQHKTSVISLKLQQLPFLWCGSWTAFSFC